MHTLRAGIDPKLMRERAASRYNWGRQRGRRLPSARGVHISSLRTARWLRRLVRRLGGYRLVLPLRLAELPLRESVRWAVARRRRDPMSLVFGSSLERFADNSAYLYLYMSAHCPEVTCTWITGSREVVNRLRGAGLRAERRWSVAGLRACLHAGWFVVSGYLADINRWGYDGATYVNLWHGIGVKPIERDVASGLVAFLHRPRPAHSLVARALLDETRPPDFVLSSTDEVSRRVFCSAFDISLDRCLPYGYPRNDHLCSDAVADQPAHPALVTDPELWRWLRRQPFVVGYFPTWQEGAGTATETSSALPTMAAIIAAQGGVLLHKAHVNTLASVGEIDGLVVLPPEHDLNVYLPLCSVIITDYSSVTADFTLLNRTMLFLLTRTEVAQPTQPAIGDLHDMLPGPVFETLEDLYEALRGLADLTPSPGVDALRRAVWDGYAGAAAERLAHFIRDRGPVRTTTVSRNITV